VSTRNKLINFTSPKEEILNIVSSIRVKSGRIALKRQASRINRNRKIFNLQQASRIGILYYLEDDTVYAKVSEYVKKLQEAGKTVKALGFVEDKKLTGQLMPKLSFDFLYPSGLSWNLKPVSIHAKDFIEEEYDILIDLSIENVFPLLYITATSNARFKVGLKSTQRSPWLDLMLEMDDTKGLDDLIEHVDHYISIINKNNES